MSLIELLSFVLYVYSYYIALLGFSVEYASTGATVVQVLFHTMAKRIMCCE